MKIALEIISFSYYRLGIDKEGKIGLNTLSADINSSKIEVTDFYIPTPRYIYGNTSALIIQRKITKAKAVLSPRSAVCQGSCQ